MTPGSVIDLLKLRGHLTEAQAEEIEDQLKNSSKDIVQFIVDYGLMTREQLFGLIAEDLGTQYFDLKGFSPPPELVAAIPSGTARLYQAVPVGHDGTALTVALADPLNLVDTDGTKLMGWVDARKGG